jgi:DNA-binding IclR family transcriptional regulator
MREGAMAHTAAGRINRKGRSMARTKKLLLTEPQAACLTALRHGKESQSKIAIEAKLALAKTAAALRTLAQLGLAEDDEAKRWHATSLGKACRFETVPDRPRRNAGSPGSGGRRLLELLDRPMRGSEIVQKLEITREAVRQLLVKLYASGHLKFADPENPFWLIMRADDKTSVLSRKEERVLSAIPRDYATDATKIRIAAGVPDGEIQQILERLLVRRLIETSEGLRGGRVYRIADAGLSHPQCVQSACRAQATRLPVESDRIRKVLSAIFDSGELRIRDVTEAVSVPHQSINALMQYLKRKRLVKKSGRDLNSPYALTAEGIAALAEMTRSLEIRRHGEGIGRP